MNTGKWIQVVRKSKSELSKEPPKEPLKEPPKEPLKELKETKSDKTPDKIPNKISKEPYHKEPYHKDPCVKGCTIVHRTVYDTDSSNFKCVDCDNFDSDYKHMAFNGYIQIVKMMIYYCRNCASDNDEIRQIVAESGRTRYKYFDIYIKNDKDAPIYCYECDELISDRTEAYYVYHFYKRIVCIECGILSGLKYRQLVSCDENFICYNCNKTYQIINPDKRQVHCGAIKKEF